MNGQKLNRCWGKVVIKLQFYLLGVFSTVLVAPPTFGAETITVSYGLLEISVSVTSLESFAQTGKMEDDLANCAKYIDAKYLEQLRQMLHTRINLSAVNISHLLYSSFGESSLQYLGEAIQTDSHLNGFYAIRAALILAAADSEGLTLLNVIKKFPTAIIRINSMIAMEMLGAFTSLASLTDRTIALLQQQSAAEATEPTIEMTHAADLQQLGALQWQKQTLTFHDQQRNRTLTTDLYLPQSSAPAPVLIMSHGLAADRSNLTYLAKHLVSHGFAVAVLEHPGSDKQYLKELLAGMVSEVVKPNEFIERPLDVSYLLDQFTELNQPNAALAGRFNLEQVGMIGHSFGGYTALALAGAEPNLEYLQNACQGEQIELLNAANLSLLLQCTALELPTGTNWQLQDKRIRAIFTMHPVNSVIFGQASLRRIQIPIMLVAGSKDMIAPAVLEQICPFTWLTSPNKHLALIEQGTHFYSTSADGLPLPLGSTSPAPSIARGYLKAMTLAFAKSYVAMQPEFRSYLTASYAQLLSQPLLPLKMIQTLTENQLSENLDFTCPGAQSSQVP